MYTAGRAASPPLLLLLLLFSLIKPGVSHTCSLVASPSRLVVRYGDPASANCSSASEVLGMGWEATVGDVGLTTGPIQFLPWKVDKLTEWDINLSCYNLLDMGGQCQTNVSLVLYQPPDSVSISYVNHSGPTVAGERYQLQCDVQNVAPLRSLAVSFYRGPHTKVDTKTHTADSPRTPVNRTFLLEVVPRREDDGVQYWCEAKLDLGREGPQPPPTMVSERLNSTVYFSPEFSCPSKLQVTEGEELSCQVIGKPLPSVTWLRDGQAVTPLAHLRRKHAGTYVINAINLNGEAKHTMELEVLFGPEFACPSKLMVKDNLTCQVTGHPLPSVTWMRDGQVVTQPTLLSREDAGRYTVTAQGALGNVSHTLVVEVLPGSGASCQAARSMLVAGLLFQLIHWL